MPNNIFLNLNKLTRLMRVIDHFVSSGVSLRSLLWLLRRRLGFLGRSSVCFAFLQFFVFAFGFPLLALIFGFFFGHLHLIRLRNWSCFWFIQLFPLCFSFGRFASPFTFLPKLLRATEPRLFPLQFCIPHLRILRQHSFSISLFLIDCLRLLSLESVYI